MTDITDEDRRLYAYFLRMAGAAEWVAQDAIKGVDDDDAPLAEIKAFRLAAEARGAERERSLLTEQFNGVYQVALADQAAARREAKALRDAAKELLAGMSSTFRARNGRDVGIEADDGEKCWIVHSDLITGLEAALSRHADQGEGL